MNEGENVISSHCFKRNWSKKFQQKTMYIKRILTSLKLLQKSSPFKFKSSLQISLSNETKKVSKSYCR